MERSLRQRTDETIVRQQQNEEEEEEEEEEELVYVAVKKEPREGKATFRWLLENTYEEKLKIVIVHVHIPRQMIPFRKRASFKQDRRATVKEYEQRERERMQKCLDGYMNVCSELKMQAEKLVIEADDAAKGLLELISTHKIDNLVMGAAADKHYPTKIKKPTSRTAITVMQQADSSCNIWFIYKGNLIGSRKEFLHKSGVAPSPTSFPSSLSSQSNQLRSSSLSDGYADTSSSDANQHDLDRHILREETTLVTYASPVITLISRSRFCTKENLGTDASDTISEDEFDNRMHVKLWDALIEVERLKKEVRKESLRRQKVENDADKALKRCKVSENLLDEVTNRRKDTEEALVRKKAEVEILKNQHDEIFEQFQIANRQNLALEVHIAEFKGIVSDLKGELSEARHLLNTLKLENADLQLQHAEAVKEVEKLRQKNEIATARIIHESTSFSEFSYSDIDCATCHFSDSHKIGEGGYGSVYRGFLRNTMVAIKLLNPQSIQGQSEFYQEVSVLGNMRHPNIVTLIGSCSEARALIYEFLSNGSLEDRLNCKNNTPPLTWQVRTRIICEICSVLIFLHSNKPYPVVHGDLKPENILLDSNFISKLSDFGICRLLMQSSTSATTVYRQTQPKGTFLYMDPEFLATGKLTTHSDVYSFGVTMLQLLTGKPALGIVKEVKEALRNVVFHKMIDHAAGRWPFVQAKQLAYLGLRCCETRKKRPDLVREVWRVLEPMLKTTSLAMASFGSVMEYSCPIPGHFICPIFQEIMQDPHFAADGYTYEAEAIKGWIDTGRKTSPMTNLPLLHCELIPNRSLRSAIQEWIQQRQQ